LSQLKFSSNVIEKCLDSKMSYFENGVKSEPHIDKIFKGTFPDDDNEIIKEFGFQTKQSKDLQLRVHFIVQKLVYNQFGNYVLQRALKVMGSDQLRKEILMTIKSLQPSLMQLKHGQKVISKLHKTYPHIFLNSNQKYPSNLKSDCSSQASAVSQSASSKFSSQASSKGSSLQFQRNNYSAPNNGHHALSKADPQFPKYKSFHPSTGLKYSGAPQKQWKPNQANGTFRPQALG